MMSRPATTPRWRWRKGELAGRPRRGRRVREADRTVCSCVVVQEPVHCWSESVVHDESAAVEHSEHQLRTVPPSATVPPFRLSTHGFLSGAHTPSLLANVFDNKLAAMCDPIAPAK